MTSCRESDIIQAVEIIVAEIERAILAEDGARADALQAQLFGHRGESAAQLVALANAIVAESPLAASAA